VTRAASSRFRAERLSEADAPRVPFFSGRSTHQNLCYRFKRIILSLTDDKVLPAL